jgi:hypothetical protein
MAQLKSTVVQGNLTASGQILADKLIKNGGSDNDILLAGGGTIAKSTYIPAAAHNTVHTTLDNTILAIQTRLYKIDGESQPSGVTTTTSALSTINTTLLNIRGGSTSPVDLSRVNLKTLNTSLTNLSNTVSALSSTVSNNYTTLNSAKVDIVGDTMTGTLTMKTSATDAAAQALTIKTPSISLTQAYSNDTVKAIYKYNSSDDCVELSFN